MAEAEEAMSSMTTVAAIGKVFLSITPPLIRFACKRRRWIKVYPFHTPWSNKRVRISFCCILSVRIQERFVLGRMKRRPEAFGPFGGVIKYFDAARDALTEFDFIPDSDLSHSPSDIDRDFRGTIPARKFSKFLDWFDATHQRETLEECLRRELAEELRENGIGTLVKSSKNVRFRRIREHYRRSIDPSRSPTTQIRYYAVFQLDTTDDETAKFASALSARARQSKNLLLATATDIKRGRLRTRESIGNQAELLVSETIKRPDMPSFRLDC